MSHIDHAILGKRRRYVVAESRLKACSRSVGEIGMNRLRRGDESLCQRSPQNRIRRIKRSQDSTVACVEGAFPAPDDVVGIIHVSISARIASIQMTFIRDLTSFLWDNGNRNA